MFNIFNKNRIYRCSFDAIPLGRLSSSERFERSIYSEETKSPPMAIISHMYHIYTLLHALCCARHTELLVHKYLSLHKYSGPRIYTSTLPFTFSQKAGITRRPSWILANQNNSIHNSTWASELCLVPPRPPVLILTPFNPLSHLTLSFFTPETPAFFHRLRGIPRSVASYKRLDFYAYMHAYREYMRKLQLRQWLREWKFVSHTKLRWQLSSKSRLSFSEFSATPLISYVKWFRNLNRKLSLLINNLSWAKFLIDCFKFISEFSKTHYESFDVHF